MKLGFKRYQLVFMAINLLLIGFIVGKNVHKTYVFIDYFIISSSLIQLASTLLISYKEYKAVKRMQEEKEHFFERV